jgi:ornithine cyclodeaminase/alanine dehydrogenase
VLVLGRADLETLLEPRDVVEALAAAFRAHAGGATIVPARSASQITTDGIFLVMPAGSRPRPAENDAGAMGAKLVAYHGDNRARGKPTIHAMYGLMDPTVGEPLALLEGTYLTAMRTGAASALAARHLARPESRRVVCFGAGVQAGFQLRCLAAVLPIEEVEVVGRDPERARAFVERMTRELSARVTLAGDAREATRRADVVTCATTATAPVLHGADLRPGTHVDAVGAFRPDTREVDTETIERARVVVDTYAGALEEAGDVLIPLHEGAIERGHMAAELAELVTGARPGRQDAEQITLFKSVGFALEDLAAARLAYNRAMQRNIGTTVTL